MALTIANLVTNLDSYIGDSSTDRITAAERLQYLTEATVWLQEETENDHQNATYKLNYLDTVSYYKVTTAVADLISGADLRRGKEDQTMSFAHKSSREVAEEIGQGSLESSWSIERRDGDAFIAVNHGSKNIASVVADMDALTAGGGTWAVDATNSDATNLTVDTIEKKQGSASLNFDIDVSQSGNNKAEIVNTTLNELDLSSFEDLASWLFEAYIPDVTNFTSFTLYWGSDTSNYWSATATTDIDGSAWAAQWNKVKIDWADATATGSPDVEAIDYVQFDLNYGAGQGDDTDFRLDYLRIVNPEQLTFHYLSWNVGADTNGSDITVFGATTDVPYFSGQYDQYKYPVARKAASLVFRSLRLKEEADEEEEEAEKALVRIRGMVPSAKTQEIKNFKALGVNFSRKNKSRR